jgi:hypothetical protein
MNKYRLTAAAQERIYMMHVRDLQKSLAPLRVYPKPFCEVVRSN